MSMVERPILFSAPMVRAILGGRKTQTRRVVKPEPHAGVRWDAIVTAGYGGWTDGHGTPLRCRYGSAGDHLWVRETWANIALKGYPPVYFYRADGKDLPPRDDRAADSKWRPSIFMPRAASRITLFVTEVRIQRLHEITEADARAEGAMYHDGHGVGHSGWRHDYKDVHADARSSFARLWSDINGANSWAENPWVWAVSFETLSEQHGGEL